MQCEKKDNRIILRPYAPIKIAGIFATGFVCVGIYLIVMMFLQEDGSFSAACFEPADWFGVAFLAVWISVACWMAYTALYSKLFYRIEIDRNGVHEKGVPFRKTQRELRWSEILDYGYYFAGNYGRSVPSVGLYTLYFSPEPLKTRNAYRKKPNKNMIKIDIVESELQETTESVVFPFCRQYCSFEPTTVEIKSHFM